MTTLAQAAAGRRLPTLAVTRLHVRACGGDVGHWERRWHGLASARASASADEAHDPDGRVDRSAPSPYVGLAAFDRGDADRLFGRAESTAELFAMATEQRFVAVFGASGSGKSSLLRAGLVARWAGNGGQFLVLVPGEHPLETYLAARAALPGIGTDASHGSGAAGLLVVVDQFEEVFTVCTDERSGPGSSRCCWRPLTGRTVTCEWCWVCVPTSTVTVPMSRPWQASCDTASIWSAR